MPDLSLWGAGLHQMDAGDHLDFHYDSDLHPTFKLRRAVNLILFLDDWDDSWGGGLEIWLPNWERGKIIHPRPNRLVTFAADQIHGLPEPLLCPPDAHRRSIALYLWDEPPANWTSCRPRASFLPSPGEPHDEVKARLRAERAVFPKT